MIFRALNGRLYLTLHSPNQSPKERPVFIPLTERADGIPAVGAPPEED